MSLQPDSQLPTLRADVTVTPDPASPGAGGFLLHDKRDHRVWQIGPGERAVLRSLDGTCSADGIRQALEHQKLLAPAAIPTAEEIAAFLEQLAGEGLLGSHSASAPTDRRAGLSTGIRRALSFPIRAILRWFIVTPWELVSLESRGELMRPSHLRLGSPDRLLALLVRLTHPLYRRATVVAALTVTGLGLGLLIAHFSDWWAAIEFLWTPRGLTVIALVGILLVHIPHQLAHGAVAVYHGARIPSWGIRTLMHIVPTLWIDVSDTMWLPEKKWRLSVMAVGLLWQGMAFTAGMVGWLLADRGSIAALVCLALSSTALFGLILNANPLARRDGYHLLSAWLELPDLRRRANGLLRAWVRWQPMPEPFTPRERRWFAGYSLAAHLFGILLTISAGMFALRLANHYNETGATFMLFAGGFVFQDHLRSIFHATGVTRAVRWLPRLMVWVLWIGLGAGVAWAMFLPYAYHAGGETILSAVEQAEVRTELEGLIGEVLVTEGQWVQPGERLAVLHSPVQERNLYAAQAQLAESRARQSALVAGRRPEELERARSTVLTAEAQLVWSTARAERTHRLFEQKIVSLQDYENATQLKLIDERKLGEAKAALALLESGTRSEAIEASEQGIKSQQAMVNHFEGNVQRTAIISPIGGYVTTPDVQNLRGRYLQPGQRDLITLVENTSIVVATIAVPEEDISGVDIGAEVTLYTWSYPGRAFKGEVTAIAPIASSDALWGGTYVRVRTEIPNADGLLKPQMSGYAKIRLEERPVWDIIFRPVLRWMRIEVWSWLP
jgi:putative peptide zinc metalloprotease protein